MYYRRCESCGSKALATATRCPKCAAAFELNDSHGKRHRLVPCPSCEIVEPAHVKVCRWCGANRQAARARSWRRRIAAVGAASSAVLIFLVYDNVVPVMRAALSTPLVSATEIDSVPDRQHVAPPAPSAPAPQLAPVPVTTAASASDSDSVELNDEGDEAEELIPRFEWEEAKATTWVNVRAGRSRDAAILAVLSPDDIVRLGATSLGWRQVTVDGATGWVDPRNFELSRQ